jgi:hypothetical protein
MNIGGNDSPLRRPLESAIAGKTEVSEVIDAVLKCLSEYRLINYRGGAAPLLSPNGRILSDLMKNPETTLREVSIRLGTTESNVTKQMTNLVRGGLVQRTNSGTSKRYKIDLEMVLSHPDISALLDAIISASEKVGNDTSDSA